MAEFLPGTRGNRLKEQGAKLSASYTIKTPWLAFSLQEVDSMLCCMLVLQGVLSPETSFSCSGKICKPAHLLPTEEPSVAQAPLTTGLWGAPGPRDRQTLWGPGLLLEAEGGRR